MKIKSSKFKDAHSDTRSVRFLIPNAAHGSTRIENKSDLAARPFRKNASDCIKRFLNLGSIGTRDDRPIIHWQSAQSSWLRALSRPACNEPLQDLSRSCNRCPEAASVRPRRFRGARFIAARTPLVSTPAVAYVSAANRTWTLVFRRGAHRETTAEQNATATGDSGFAPSLNKLTRKHSRHGTAVSRN